MRESSCRRSSFRGGMGSLTILPSLAGFSPRLARWMARSMAPIWPGSKGCTTMRVGSGTERVATWFRGICVP